MGWRDALHGRNKDVRADASEIIVGNPPKSAELTDTFDSERALKLLNTKAERGITREAMFILLCLQSNPDNAETLAQYFIRKEYAPYGAPSVSEQSYLIFKEFLVTNKVEPNQLFDNPSYLNNERIKSIIAELVSDFEPYINKLKEEFQNGSYGSSIADSYVKLLYKSLGEKETFNLLLEITKQYLDDYRYVGDKWFTINQNGGRTLWESEYVEKQLIEICKSETSMILENGERKRGGEYLLYGTITALGINFGTKSTIEVIFDSLLKLKNLRSGLTFHYRALCDNLEITSELMIHELSKKHPSNDYDLICDHFCEILNHTMSHGKQYHSLEIKKLIRDISPHVSNDKFEYFIKHSRPYFDLNELKLLVKLVASTRFGYDEDMNSAALDEFIQSHLYECSYLLSAVKRFADDGSDIAKKWIATDSVKIKIDSMLENQNHGAISFLLEGLESDDSFVDIVNYLISKSTVSVENKKTILNSIIYNRAYQDFGQFLVDELSIHEKTKDNTLIELSVKASSKYMNEYTNDSLCGEMISQIISIFEKRLSSEDDLMLLKKMLSSLEAVKFGQPSEDFRNYLLSVFETIPIDIKYNAAVCLNGLGAWNSLIENTFVEAIDKHMDSPQFLYGHIHQIRNGKHERVSDSTMDKVLDLLVNHENLVVKMFAIDCLGFKVYQPSIPHLIEILRLGSQSDEEMKFHIRDNRGRVTTTVTPKPPQLAPFGTSDVYTSAIHALARLHKYSVEDLLKSLSNNDENIAIGAFLVFELHQNSFKEVVFSEEQIKLMQELRKKSGM